VSFDALEGEFGHRQAGATYRRRPGAYGVALRDGLVLVVDTPEGRFLPGGAIDGEESVLEALRREVAEETGYELVDAAPIGMASQLMTTRAAGEAIEKVGHFFRVALLEEPAGGGIEADHRARWVPAQEAIATLAEEASAWAVRRAVGEI
jgi:8-oxo-dGTP diphosphatase